MNLDTTDVITGWDIMQVTGRREAKEWWEGKQKDKGEMHKGKTTCAYRRTNYNGGRI